MFMRLSNGKSINRDQIIGMSVVEDAEGGRWNLVIAFFDGQEMQTDHPTQESAEAEHEKVLRAKYTLLTQTNEGESMTQGIYR